MKSFLSTSSGCPNWTFPSADLSSSEPSGRWADWIPSSNDLRSPEPSGYWSDSWTDSLSKATSSLSEKIETAAKRSFLPSSKENHIKGKMPAEFDRRRIDSSDLGRSKKVFSKKTEKARGISDLSFPPSDTTAQPLKGNPYLAEGSGPQTSDILADVGCVV